MKFIKCSLILTFYLLQTSAPLYGEINKTPIIQQTFTLNTPTKPNKKLLLLEKEDSKLTEKILNPLKHYLDEFQNASDSLIYLSGTCIEKNDSVIDLHILNLESCLNIPAEFLAKLILSQNADVVCIQDMDTDYAHDLYELLQNTYAYFLHNSFPTLHRFLIASKHPMKNAQFNPFKDQKNNEGCLDFIIKNKSMPIGHIYLAHLQKDPKTQALKFLEAVEKMEIDYAKEQIPFVLCG